MRKGITHSTIIIIVFLLFINCIFFGCRKLDRENKDTTPLNQTELVEKFFSLPANASPELKALADDIKKQDDKYHFVNEFARKNGLPVWDQIVANTAISARMNTQNSGSMRIQTNSPADTLIFFIPLRYTDSSIRTYIACSRFDNQYHYSVYRREYITNLYVPDSSALYFRFSMLSLFGLFEKSINNKDTIYVNGQYQSPVENASITFSTVSSRMAGTSRTTTSDCSGGSWVYVCFGQQTRAKLAGCLYVQVYVPPSSNCPGINNGGQTGTSGGGGGTGGGNPPAIYQCPTGQWWCENGEYRFIGGTLYTSQSYPGINQGLPWLWWETGNYQTANLSVIFAIVNAYNLNLQQSLYLVNNNVTTVYDPNQPFSHLQNPINASDDPEINNGIELFDLPQNLPNPPVRKIGETTPRGNVEDLQHGTTGNTTGVLQSEISKNNNELFVGMTDLFASCTAFDSDLALVAGIWLGHFRNNNSNQNEFSNATLNTKVNESTAFNNFLKLFGNRLRDQLNLNNGDINQIGVINMGNTRPIFNGLHNKFHGLQILINDTEYTEINLDRFEVFANNTWEADVTVTIIDHFGLDRNDALTYQSWHSGFADWWLLQHTRDFKPFKTKITVRKTIKGVLN